MKKLKFCTLAACIALCTTGLRAEDDYALLYPSTDEISIWPGDSFNLVLNLDNTIIPSTFQFFVSPPDGITVAKNKLKYDITYNSERLDPDVYTLTATQVSDTNDVVFIVYNLLEYNNEEGNEYKVQPGTGEFATIKLTASSDIEPGQYELKLYDILFVTLNEDQYRSPNAAVKINVLSVATGLSSLLGDDNADSGASYYNLTGFPVSPDNMSPGLYIRVENGKSRKVLVK